MSEDDTQKVNKTFGLKEYKFKMLSLFIYLFFGKFKMLSKHQTLACLLFIYFPYKRREFRLYLRGDLKMFIREGATF